MRRENIFRAVEWTVVAILLGSSLFLYQRSRNIQLPEIAKDTVKIKVPVYKDFPDPKESASAGFVPVPRYMFFTDTLTEEIPVPVPGKTDTVYLTREQKYYEERDGRLRIWISGYQPQLDRYEMDDIMTTITQTYKPPNKRWGLGVTAGYGATVVDHTVKLAPYLGVGITYNFLQW